MKRVTVENSNTYMFSDKYLVLEKDGNRYLILDNAKMLSNGIYQEDENTVTLYNLESLSKITLNKDTACLVSEGGEFGYLI